MTKSRLRVAVAVIGTVFATLSTVSAQQASPAQVQHTSVPGEPAPPGTYGTAGNIVYNLGPEDFSPWNTAWSSFYVTSSILYFTSGGTTVSAPLHLPNGAVVDSFDYFYYDNHPTVNPSAALHFTNSFGVETEIAPVNFFPNVSNGNNHLQVTLQTPVTINNLTTHYSLSFSLTTGGGGVIALYRVRVNYRLQVSPAPGTATFADVPVGSSFHRFVEALVSSGITAGCGGGNYCPNAPITRGQMAVFLAAALGLHWPN